MKHWIAQVDALIPRKDLYITIFFCVLLGGLSSLNLFGALLSLIVFFVSIYVLISLFMLLFKPKSARQKGIKQLAVVAVLWFMTCAMSYAIHTYKRNQRKVVAENVIKKVQHYKIQHGHYPHVLSETAMDTTELKNLHAHRIIYRHDGKPGLMYRDTFMMFSTYHYDFENQEWEYFAD